MNRRALLMPAAALALSISLGCAVPSPVSSSSGFTGSAPVTAPAYPGTVFFGDSITCGFGGDNTFSGGGSFTDGGFASIVRDTLGGTYENNCRGGDQVLDAAVGGRVYGLHDPAESGNPAYFLGDSTNDVAMNQGNPVRQGISQAVYLGTLYWLGIPPSGKRMAQQCSNSGFVADNSVEQGMGMRSTTLGDTLDCSIETTHGEPLIVAFLASLNDIGTADVQVDGVSVASFYTRGTSTLTIQSLYGLPSTVMAVRLPVATGLHHLVVKNNSPLVGGSVQVEWVAAPRADSVAAPLPLVSALSTIHSLETQATVATSPVGSVNGTQFDALSGQYDQWIQSTVAQAKSDGLNVQYIDTRTALGADPSNYHDFIHPNQSGYVRMAAKILAAFGR